MAGEAGPVGSAGAPGAVGPPGAVVSCNRLSILKVCIKNISVRIKNHFATFILSIFLGD